MGQPQKLINWPAIGALVLVAALVTGCAGGPKPSLDQIRPVCTALLGPIKYNSTDPKSLRFAARKLVPDLKARNQVGRWLGCPAYQR